MVFFGFIVLLVFLIYEISLIVLLLYSAKNCTSNLSIYYDSGKKKNSLYYNYCDIVILMKVC